MRLIVNADDFGLCKGVNEGIIEAHKNGIVTSTTLMVTMSCVEHALKLASNFPSLGIGLHLNCTLGKPLTNCKTLIKDNGEFYKPKEKPNQDLFDEEEIYLEFLAQYDEFIRVVKRKPTHIDSHLYSHQIYEKVKKAALRLAKEKDIAIREFEAPNYEVVDFIGTFKCLDSMDPNEVKQNLISKNSEILKHDLAELMCHPAYLDEFIMTTSSYNKGRLKELNILTSEEVKIFIKNNNIQLINYSNTRR